MCRVLRYNIYTYEGTDEPWVADSNRMDGNRFTRNTIVGSPESIKLVSADFTRFSLNTFDDVTKIRFEDSTNTIIKLNTGLDDAKMTITDSCFHKNSDDMFVPLC